MQKQKPVIIAAAIVFLISSLIVSVELKKYTPVDSDETKIIDNYDKITEKMNEIIEKRENTFKKRLEKETRQAKKYDLETEEIIKKYGIKKILKFETTKQNLQARKKICALYDCDSKEMKELTAFWGLDNVSVVEFDFNDDGRNEIIGNWRGSYAHKGGCLDYADSNNTKEHKVSQFVCNVSSDKITVLNHKTNGYYDLVITIRTFLGVPYRDIFRNYANE